MLLFNSLTRKLNVAHSGIIFGIPLSLLADRIGRKPVILLFLLGIFLSDTWTKVVCKYLLIRSGLKIGTFDLTVL